MQYSCTLWCALFAHHPLHLLYNKFHADVSAGEYAPAGQFSRAIRMQLVQGSLSGRRLAACAVGGHDGFGDPGGNSEYHYIHHSKFECASLRRANLVACRPILAVPLSSAAERAFCSTHSGLLCCANRE